MFRLHDASFEETLGTALLSINCTPFEFIAFVANSTTPSSALVSTSVLPFLWVSQEVRSASWFLSSKADGAYEVSGDG